MKNLLLLSGMFFLLLLGACSTPAEYATAIMDEVADVDREAADIAKRIRNVDGVNNALEKGKEQVKKSLEKLEKMPAFRGDDLLRQAAIEYVIFYEGLFSNEYQEAYILLKKSSLYETDAVRFAEILTTVSKEEIEVRNRLIAEHLAFIERYGLLVESAP